MSKAITDEQIDNWTLDDWMEFSRRDDCLERMVPSDLRQLIGSTVEQAVKAERARLIDRLKRLEFHAVQDPVCRFSPDHEYLETISPGQKAIRHCIELLEADNG